MTSYAHTDLLRLKVAGLLAVLDDRHDINTDDWRLAGIIIDASNRVRTGIKTYAGDQARRHEDLANAKAGRREIAIRDTVANRATTAMARTLSRRVHRVWDRERRATKLGEAQSACRSTDRRDGSFVEAVDLAIDHGWVVVDGDGLRPGASRPA